jgi:hypothetical protein
MEVTESKKYYNYKGKEYMKLNMNNNSYNTKDVKICAYTVVNKEIPFLRFLLTNVGITTGLTFPKVPFIKNMSQKQFIEYSKVCLFGLLMLTDFENFNKLIEFNGFYECDEIVYMFIDITKCNYESNDISKSNACWFALIDEIINLKHVCNVYIENNVRNLFLKNENLCFLEDDVNNIYEIPVARYVGKPENKLNFTYTFGESKCDKNEILGPYLYFKDFNNAFNDGCKYKNGGIVRFAVFIGCVKYIENYPNDQIDESEVKKNKLNNDSLNKRMECLTIRITDHDGNWAYKYDSVYLGDIELDDGSIYKNNITVVKEYEQHVPLSYHYVNKNISNVYSIN